MTSLSARFQLLDNMRKAAGIAPARLAHRAGILWLRYQSIRAGLEEPKARELRALERALQSHPIPEPRATRTSPSAGRMGKTPAVAVTPTARPGLSSRAGEG